MLKAVVWGRHLPPGWQPSVAASRYALDGHRGHLIPGRVGQRRPAREV